MPNVASILVVDDDAVSRHVLTQNLQAAGFHVVALDDGEKALNWLEQHVPVLLLLDLVMPAPDGHTILHYVRSSTKLRDLPVVVLTALDSDEEIQRIFECGADDYVHKPFRPTELVARIRGQLRVREYVERLAARERDQQTVLELTQTLASTLDVRDILFAVVKRVADVAHVDRCSIVLFNDSREVGYVLATSDDVALKDFPIDLGKYPEIREVLSTGNALVIRDTHAHPLLEAIRHHEPARGFKSLALFPILHDQGAMGVLFLRSRGRNAFAEHEINLVNMVANAMAIALRNAKIVQSYRAQTEENSFARAEAERRAEVFRRYADFFESAADGLVVVDIHGKLLFANPRAREITGFSESELLTLKLEGLISPLERDRVTTLLCGFADGNYPRGVDLTFINKLGKKLTISVNTSPVLHERNAVLFSFRDVTLERKTAVELKQTKEFLECVIESSVDGIVSADLKGTVLLFNRAASRIFGHAPENVIGKMSVEKLYPPGVARDIMKRIRDPAQNGYGRLQDYRVNLLASDGQPLPVHLSASLVLENSIPIGSVGIFTDIRDKLRMEAELTLAQEELRSREKLSVVAELAGATAHELNQPLTSVIGYAELVRRRLSDDAQLFSAANIIVHEAERMAEIVRKIGRITKYETKAYVGAAKILDLEKASANDAGELSR